MRENKPTKKAKSRFTYSGEEIARPLIHWLNAGGDKLPGVVELLQIADRHHKTENPKLKKLLKDKANAILADYRFTAVIDEMNGLWKIEWHDFGRGGVGAQATFILLLFDLAKQGLWQTVQRCEKPDCQKWFFKRFMHQRFCSDECRIAVLQNDPARREQRAEKMRDLRRLKKLRQRKQKVGK
jgi:hypothetical protein